MPIERTGSKIPLDRVQSMKSQGLQDQQIIENLKKENYSFQEINDALEQSEIVKTVNQRPFEEPLDFPVPPTPSTMSNYQVSSPSVQTIPQQSFFDPSSRLTMDRIEEIAESIINEKWSELTKEFGNFNSWKEKVNTDVLSIKQEIVRTQDRFENLQKAVLGKINEYNESVVSVSTEMKALEKVLERIINPLTTNIKELSRITEELKGKRK